jgi:hypothetical protein
LSFSYDAKKETGKKIKKEKKKNHLIFCKKYKRLAMRSKNQTTIIGPLSNSIKSESIYQNEPKKGI